MLAIPSFKKINDLTVYQDDAIWTRFYLVPSTPTIRHDENGHPVFLLTIFHTSDQAHEATPATPRGGGFMNFDVQFTVDEPTTEAARKDLQAWVDDEYARRRADPKYSMLPDYAAAAGPRVELNDPLLSSGTVSMHTTQSALLVSGRFAEAPASLVSGSTAVFNMDLTETGASFMHDLFMKSAGDGRVDLTPVQVIYDLKMWARLPPVSITVTGDSERIHQTLVKVSETNRDNPCTPAEVETYQQNGTNSSTLKETGAVTVKIDKGDATVPDDVVQALQQYALDLFDTMVKERFLVPAEEDAAPLDFDTAMPDGGLDSGWAAILYAGANYAGAQMEVDESVGSIGSLNDAVGSIRVRSGHRLTLYSDVNFGGTSREFTASVGQIGAWGRQASSARVTRPPSSRYKVRETLNQSTMHLEIKVDRSQVVEWPTGGQATLETFFAGLSEQELQRYLVELTADDFNSLGVTVRALVDFDKQPVQAVEVQTEYSAKDGDGQLHTTPGSFTFRAGEVAAKTFDPTIIGGTLEYRFRYRIIYDDGTSSDYTDWETTTNRSLNVAIADPGKLALEVSSASLNWDILRSVRVDLVYSDPLDGTASLQKSLELTKATPVGKWEQSVSRQMRGTVATKITYFLTDEKVVEGPSQAIDVSNTLFIVPPPQVDVLNVNLVPAGNWSDVAQVVVTMEYAIDGGQIYDKTFRFTALDQIAEWTVLLRDPNQRTFRYRTVVTYKSGGADESAWVTKTGDQAVVIEVKGSPKLHVNVLSNLVDFTRTPVVTVTLSYGDEKKTLSFTAAGATVWEVPAVSNQKEYTYEITWHPASGNAISSGPTRTADTELFIPRASLPTVGKLDVMIRGFAVDFAATPFVDVALIWKDGNREERTTVTLSKEQPNASWSVDIGDRTQRTYQYSITYNLADGTRAAGAHGDTDDPVISVTRH
jgi:hypothetical protein